MGRPMARRLAAAGFDVCGWNRTSLDRSLTREIALVGSLADATDADVLVLMLADSRAVGDVLVELEPLLRSGQLVVDMGSSDPRDSVDRASRLTGHGIGWVDELSGAITAIDKATYDAVTKTMSDNSDVGAQPTAGTTANPFTGEADPALRGAGIHAVFGAPVEAKVNTTGGLRTGKGEWGKRRFAVGTGVEV